jgi:hypothetical protein
LSFEANPIHFLLPICGKLRRALLAHQIFVYYILSFQNQILRYLHKNISKIVSNFLIFGEKIQKMARFKKLDFSLFYQNLIKLTFFKNSRRTWLRKVWTNWKWPETYRLLDACWLWIPVNYRQKNLNFTYGHCEVQRWPTPGNFGLRASIKFIAQPHLKLLGLETSYQKILFCSITCNPIVSL